MKRSILSLAILAALTLSASAGTISVTFTSGATTAHPSGFTYTGSVTVPDAALEGYYSWSTNAANTTGFNGTPVPTCAPVAPATTCTPTPLTTQQSLGARLLAVVNADWSSVTQAAAQQAATQAAATAAANVPSLTVTPNQ